MPQRAITITDVFAFSDKFITFKGNVLVIEVSILTPKKVYGNMQFIFR